MSNMIREAKFNKTKLSMRETHSKSNSEMIIDIRTLPRKDDRGVDSDSEDWQISDDSHRI